MLSTNPTTGTEMDHYLAGLLDAKGGFQVRRTSQLIYLVLDFSGNPEIPLALIDHYGVGTEHSGRWIVTRASELKRVLQRALPYMQSVHRGEYAWRVYEWARAASHDRPRDPVRAAAFEALA